MSGLPTLLLVFVISVLTFLLTAIGIQVFLLLKSFRESLKKVNHFLGNIESVSSSISSSVNSFSQKLGEISFFDWFFRLVRGFLAEKTEKGGKNSRRIF